MKKAILIFVTMFAFTVASAQSETTVNNQKTQPGIKDYPATDTPTQSSTTSTAKNQEAAQTITKKKSTKKMTKKAGASEKMNPDQKKMEATETKSTTSGTAPIKK